MVRTLSIICSWEVWSVFLSFHALMLMFMLLTDYFVCVCLCVAGYTHKGLGWPEEGINYFLLSFCILFLETGSLTEPESHCWWSKNLLDALLWIPSILGFQVYVDTYAGDLNSYLSAFRENTLLSHFPNSSAFLNTFCKFVTLASAFLAFKATFWCILHPVI